MNTTDTPQLLTRSEFAALKGWSKSYVTKLGNQGKLVTTPDGKRVDVAATLSRLDQASDPAKEHVAQRHAEGRVQRDVVSHIHYSAPTQPAGPSGPPAGTSGGEAGFYASKTRRETALAEMAELELQERLGKLVKRDLVEASVEAVYRMLRDSLMGLPTQVSPELASMTDAFEIEKRLLAEIRRRLEDLTKLSAQDLRQLDQSTH